MTIPPSLAQPSIVQAPLEEVDPNAINKSIIDAKGDLIAGSAADTPARLPVGTDGYVLLADSSQTTGLRWGLDPTATTVDAKGDILVGTAPDTIGRLPVGTNGQVLVADSSTGTGLAWSSEADPTAIAKTIIDAKGDLIVGTANDTPARLPIGTNGQYLVANSSATEGMAWTTPNIALGTETSGNYVAGITGGTGVTVSGSGSEGATPSVAIGQDVATSATVAFGGLNVDSGTLYVDATNNRVGINDTTPSFSLDVTGDANITTALTVGTTVTASDFVGDLSGILQIDVKNLSGGTLAAGTPVYISGTVGATQVAEVQASRADTPSTMPAVGLLQTSLAANATGHAAVIGLVNNLNTSTYTLNAPLYVAPTGGLTNTRPTASTDVVQVVGFAARLNTNTGAILATIYDQTRAPNAISISGNIVTTAGQFTGSGAGLTSIPAGQLTGTISSTNIGNDSVALGTKTTGNYVQTLSGGTGVSVTGGTGEGSTPSVAIGQAVATTDSPQFAGITTTGTATLASVSSGGSIAGNSLSAVTSITGASLTVNGTQIDPTGATSNQVLQYNGTKFAPATVSGSGIPETLLDAKGDLIVASANDTAARLGVGSTNQVLTVDSAQTLGVKWAAVDDTTKIAKSIIDAKGDIVTGTANDTPAILTVGANNTLLVADSSQTTGLKWSSTLSGLTLTTPVISSISNTGTLTLPTSTDTLVGRATTDTLTNKTLTSPTITTPTATGGTVTGSRLDQTEEKWNIVASAATGTINLDVKTASIWYYTSNATANHTINVRGDGSTTLSSLVAVGDSITVVWANTNGTTAYWPSTFQVDGSTITPKWQGGTAPTGGNASAIDLYSYTIVKTAATPTYTVFASQTQFK